MFGQSLLSAFGIACTTDTDQLFGTNQSATSIATYQLNNATTSIPSNTYPGTASNITYAAGKFGNAAVFNGSSSVIDISSSTINPASPYTISMWFNASNAASYEGLYTGISSSPVVGELTILKANATTIQTFSVATNGSNNLDANTVTVPTLSNNTWYNIVVIADRNLTYKSRVFINGVEGTNYTVGSASTNLTSTIKIGFADNNYFDGLIDQIRFFNSSLPQPAITALYNETTTTAQSASIDYVLANPNSVAYYKMSDATDQLGNYNGTATNVNFNTEGKFGFAGAFNGSSSKIVLPTTTLDSIKSNGSFGVSAWFKTSETGDRKCIFSAFESSYLMLEVTSGNQLKGIVSNTSGTNTELTVPITVTDGNWHHAVFTGNNGSLSLYLDNGTPQTSSSWNGTFFSGTGGTGIGIRMASSDHWDGDIDQIRLYDSVLSASNVSTLYKEVECEPAAINALDYFNTVLYTGNGGTQAVTGVGFKPDFSWVKNRNTAGNSHELADVVRGVDNTLNSNTANGEYNNATYQFNSFDTDGITVTDDAAGNYAVNGNNETYVAWNWKAPLANLSTSFNGSSSYVNLAFASLNVNNNFTWSFWINFNSFTLYDTPIGFFMNGYTNYLDVRGVSGNNAYLNMYDGNSGLTTPANSISTGSWYHVAFTKSSTTGRKIYINGSEEASDSSTSNSGSSSAGRNQIGAYSSSGNPTTPLLNVDGDMAQVRIFHSALTASQISDLYAEPAASNNTLNYPAGAGCIAAYPLQTDAVDLSGNYSGSSGSVTFGQPGYLTGNTNGTIPSTVAANVEAGFSIVRNTGTSNYSDTIGHGLSKAPELVIQKPISSSVDWYVLANLDGGGAWDYGVLNATTAFAVDNPQRFSTNSTTINNWGWNGYDMINYCFTSIPGYSKIGSYIGTGAAGNFQYTGFQPSWLMIKNSTTSGTGWAILDTTRDGTTENGNALFANSSGAEWGPSNTTIDIDFTATGFTIQNNYVVVNGGSDTYIYLAIA